MLNKVVIVQVSDTTMYDSIAAAGNKKLIQPFNAQISFSGIVIKRQYF